MSPVLSAKPWRARRADLPACGAAVIFSRLGPYHCARLATANRQMPIFAIEVAGNTSTYPWDKGEFGADFRRRTLFPEAASEKLDWQELNHRLRRELNAMRPAAVAVPGWSDRAAL